MQASDTSPHTTHTGTTETSASPVNNDKYANGQATVSSGNNEIPTKNGIPVLSVSASGNNDGSYDLGTIDVTYTSLPKGYDWVADLPSYTYEAFTYTNVGGMVDVGYQWYNGDIGGYYAAGLLGASALGGKAGGKLFTHFSYLEKYGTSGYKTLQNGKNRYYGDISLSRNPGEMKGRRYVHEWDPNTGNSRGWHETIDYNGNVRIVRPQINGGSKTHYSFDEYGNYLGSR